MLRTNSRFLRASAALRALTALGLAAAAAMVGGCGGGGGGGGSSGGGGGASASAQTNVVQVTVARGLGGIANIPTVSVTVCAPGTGTCETIDNIQLDTESFGLRLVGAAAASVLGSLPQQTVGGFPVAECTHFADGFIWGSVRTADIKIAGESASNVPIQIVGDLGASTVPVGCQNGPNESSAANIGANGILGVGVALHDCGSLCVGAAINSNYYVCPNNTNCTQTVLALSQQVANPVSRFSTDNNGVILTVPAVGATGQASVTGSLTFGIGTRSNNVMGAAQKYTTSASGDVNATINGSPVTAFFDSGSNAYFFTDGTLTSCSGNAFYCPGTPTTRTVTIASFNNVAPGAVGGTSVTMNVANANALFASGNFAFNNMAGNLGMSNLIDFGMSFFYGRTVYYGFDQTATIGGASPFIAF
jgi:hypothetical protein